jgi:hypothetical protein
MCYIIIINTGKTQVVYASIPIVKGDNIAAFMYTQERTRSSEGLAKTAIAGVVL